MSSVRVLVVDDDRLNRIMLTKLLERDAHEVRVAADGREALDALEETSFDLVLLDVVMPEVDGIEVLQTIKRSSQWWNTPVIMISAVEETNSIVRCIELGAEDYLLKPFDPVLLRARVNASLARKRFHDLELEYHNIVKEQRAQLQELNGQLARRVWAQVGELEQLNRLRRFLPSATAERLLASGDEPFGPHRQVVAVLAVALDGVAAVAAQGDPEEAFDVLNEFHATVEALADRFEATLACGPGDGVTVVFNDPVPCPDPVTRAAAMGLALADDLPARLDQWRQRYGCDLGWGGGVGYGDAVLGRVGGEHHWEYAAVGPAVEAAARLRDRARGSAALLIDPAAAESVNGALETQALDDAARRVVAVRAGTVEAGR